MNPVWRMKKWGARPEPGPPRAESRFASTPGGGGDGSSLRSGQSLDQPPCDPVRGASPGRGATAGEGSPTPHGAHDSFRCGSPASLPQSRRGSAPPSLAGDVPQHRFARPRPGSARPESPHGSRSHAEPTKDGLGAVRGPLGGARAVVPAVLRVRHGVVRGWGPRGRASDARGGRAAPGPAGAGPGTEGKSEERVSVPDRPKSPSIRGETQPSFAALLGRRTGFRPVRVDDR